MFVVFLLAGCLLGASGLEDTQKASPSLVLNGGTPEKLDLGCFPDIYNHTSLPYLLWDSSSNTATGCIRACRQQRFKFAGLMNTKCYCGNEEIRGEFYERENETDTINGKNDEELCTSTCPGDSSEQCGGPNTNRLHIVPEERRYLGCYNDDPELPDLSTLQWGPNANRSAHDCVDTCQVLGFYYAGVQNGGACYCGLNYGRHGAQNEELCNVSCTGYIRQNCGGELANAVYMTERSLDLTLNPDELTVALFDGQEQMTEVNLGYFNTFKHLRSIVTKKCVLTASDIVLSPGKTNCVENCYTECGEIYHPHEFNKKGDDVTVRAFHIKLSDLGKYVAQDTKRLYVYAQTVVVDVSLDIGYALLIRTRELILERGNAGTYNIKVSSAAPDLGREKDLPAQPEIMFMKQSLMCAQILFGTNSQDKYNLALAVADDVTHTTTNDKEANAFISQTSTIITEVVGILRAGMHYVPFYTKSHMSDVLNLFSTEISIYKEDLDRIMDYNLQADNYIATVEQMANIYSETDIPEARASLDSALVTVARSNATYHNMHEQFEEEKIEMDKTGDEFERNLEGAISQAKKDATVRFKNILRRGIGGAIKNAAEAKMTAQKLQGLQIRVENLGNMLFEVSKMTEAVMSMSSTVDTVIERLSDMDSQADLTQFNDNIEAVVSLHVNLVQWGGFLDNCHIVMSDPDLIKVEGAKEYHGSMRYVGNWGRGVTEGVIELAESLRIATEKRLILDAKLQQQQRIEGLLAELRQGLLDREPMTYAMIEQTYDVRMDLNGALIIFCQAYFFENLYDCKDSYKPSFGGSLKDLLLKINAARKDALLIGDVPSSVQRKVSVKDIDTDPECDDMTTCPLNYFKKHRVMYYNLPLDHEDLWDLDKYRVAEVTLEIEGETVGADERDNSLVKFIIESTGEFRGRAGGVDYHFLSRGLSLMYEYDTVDGYETIQGDVYTPYRDIVSHVTPYTTWIIRIADDRSHNIDISRITSFNMKLVGSAVNRDDQYFF